MKHKSTDQCGTSKDAQAATLKSIPATTTRHNDPNVKPIAGKAMTGGKTK